MTDTTLAAARTADQPPNLLETALRLFRNARARDQLSRLDDRMLKDIGLTRADVARHDVGNLARVMDRL